VNDLARALNGDSTETAIDAQQDCGSARKLAGHDDGTGFVASQI